MKVYGVIMAGGGGARFWPLSRNLTPKQLLNLSGKDLMVNETIDRLAHIVDKKDIFIVTNTAQAPLMKEATAGRVCDNHILSEPCARNTAACIGYAAVEIIKKYGDGIMVVAPSDAYIKNVDKLTQVLKLAVKTAQEQDKLVTVGITPGFPSTGYGYINFDKNEAGEVKRVKEFKEKPDLETAKAYVQSGNYAWNSGMFIWRASTILKNFERFLPNIYADLNKIGEAIGTEQEASVINEVYPSIQSISIDYGIMERSSDVVVIPAEFGWSDVGSWDMLEVLHSCNDNGNILLGEQINIDTSDTTIFSSGRMVAVVGVANLVIVETPDAVLVCDKSRVQDVKKVVDTLNAKGRTDLL